MTTAATIIVGNHIECGAAVVATLQRDLLVAVWSQEGRTAGD